MTAVTLKKFSRPLHSALREELQVLKCRFLCAFSAIAEHREGALDKIPHRADRQSAGLVASTTWTEPATTVLSELAILHEIGQHQWPPITTSFQLTPPPLLFNYLGSAAGFGLFTFPAASVDHQVAAFYAPEFCAAAPNPSPPSSAGSAAAIHQDSSAAAIHENSGEWRPA